MLNFLILLISMYCISAYAEDTVLEVISIDNRPASELESLITPFLEESEHIIANRSNLIVKASPERVEEIKELISRLDTRLVNLQITVVQSRTKTAEALNANIRISNRSSRLSGQIRGRFAQTERLNDRDSTQIIKTLEGSPAYIKTGASHPVQNINIYNSGYGSTGISNHTKFIETSTGFMVNPRLNNNLVTLEIIPWSEKMNNNRAIETQSAQTTIQAKLGQWIEIGGISETENKSGKRILAHSYSTNNKKLKILIKVDKAQ